MKKLLGAPDAFFLSVSFLAFRCTFPGPILGGGLRYSGVVSFFVVKGHLNSTKAGTPNTFPLKRGR
jgi:hypothetical protein